MATPAEMPRLGNTVEECLISQWVKRKGETVSAETWWLKSKPIRPPSK